VHGHLGLGLSPAVLGGRDRHAPGLDRGDGRHEHALLREFAFLFPGRRFGFFLSVRAAATKKLVFFREKNSPDTHPKQPTNQPTIIAKTNRTRPAP
jgi:hypothetical protein